MLLNFQPKPKPKKGKLYFEHLLGILDFSENIYICLVDLSFIKHVFYYFVRTEGGSGGGGGPDF